MEPEFDSLEAKKNSFRELSIRGDEVSNQSHHNEERTQDKAERGQNDRLNMTFALPHEIQNQET